MEFLQLLSTECFSPEIKPIMQGDNHSTKTTGNTVLIVAQMLLLNVVCLERNLRILLVKARSY